MLSFYISGRRTAVPLIVPLSFTARRLLPTHTSRQVEPSLSPAEMEKIPGRALEDQKKLLASAPTEWNSGFGKASGGGSARRGRTSKRQAAEGQDDDGEEEEEEEDSSLELLRRLLVAEMQGQGASGGLNNRWIDRDSLLQVGVPSPYIFSA